MLGKWSATHDGGRTRYVLITGILVVLYAFAALVAIETPDWPMVIFLGVVSLAPLVLGIKVRRTRLRYAAAEFEVTATPRLGDKLEGVLHLPHPVGKEARIRGNLVCQREGGADHADPVLCRSYGYGSPTVPLEATVSHFPVCIDIPSGGLPSGRNGSYWMLQFSAEAGFSGLAVAFRVFVEE